MQSPEKNEEYKRNNLKHEAMFNIKRKARSKQVIEIKK